jgi:selenide,water dikinase
MVVDSGLGLRLFVEAIPIYPEARAYAAMGLVPAGTYNNRLFRENFILFSEGIDPITRDILFDAQTSGGLVIVADPGDADPLVTALRSEGIEEAVVIGEVVATPADRIVVA